MAAGLRSSGAWAAGGRRRAGKGVVGAVTVAAELRVPRGGYSPSACRRASRELTSIWPVTAAVMRAERYSRSRSIRCRSS